MSTTNYRHLVRRFLNNSTENNLHARGKYCLLIFLEIHAPIMFITCYKTCISQYKANEWQVKNKSLRIKQKCGYHDIETHLSTLT